MSIFDGSIMQFKYLQCSSSHIVLKMSKALQIDLILSKILIKESLKVEHYPQIWFIAKNMKMVGTQFFYFLNKIL